MSNGFIVKYRSPTARSSDQLKTATICCHSIPAVIDHLQLYGYIKSERDIEAIYQSIPRDQWKMP